MCEIKDLFFHEEEETIQFHPKKSEYVNISKFCLHMWRYKNMEELLMGIHSTKEGKRMVKEIK